VKEAMALHDKDGSGSMELELASDVKVGLMYRLATFEVAHEAFPSTSCAPNSLWCGDIVVASVKRQLQHGMVRNCGITKRRTPYVTWSFIIGVSVILVLSIAWTLYWTLASLFLVKNVVVIISLFAGHHLTLGLGALFEDVHISSFSVFQPTNLTSLADLEASEAACFYLRYPFDRSTFAAGISIFGAFTAYAGHRYVTSSVWERHYLSQCTIIALIHALQGYFTFLFAIFAMAILLLFQENHNAYKRSYDSSGFLPEAGIHELTAAG
jgi:hypothetical protein